MKHIILFLSIAILASCSPQRRLARLLERYPLPEIHDTTYLPGEIIYRDTTVYRYLAGDTVTVELPIYVRRDLPDTAIHAYTELAEATARLKRNKLRLELIQYDSLFQWKLDSAIRLQTPDTIRIVHETTVPEYIKPNPFWKTGFFILAVLIVVALVLYFVTRR